VEEGIGHQFAHHEFGVFDHVAAIPLAAAFGHEPAGHGHIAGVGTELDPG
jgi:hypothetical protein